MAADDDSAAPVSSLKRKYGHSNDHKRSSGTIKLPVVAEFGSVQELEQAIDVRLNEASYCTAALVQFDKRLKHVIQSNAGTKASASTHPVVQYINSKDPTCQLVFQAWDLSNRTNNSQLSAACLDCFTSILRFSSLDPFETKDSPILKRLLSSTISLNDPSSSSSFPASKGVRAHQQQSSASYLDRALNPGRNDVTTSALKLFNTVVAYKNGAFARRLFSCLSLNPKTTSRLFKTRLRDQNRDPLQKPDIRTLLVGLVLGFLSASDSKLKTMVVEHRGLMSGMIKGLNEDSQILVNHVLTVVWRELLDDRSVGLDKRRSVVDETLVNELVKLYDSRSDDSNSSTDQAVRTSAHRFLFVVSDWLAGQIDTTKVSSGSASGGGGGAAKALSMILKSLKVTEDSLQRDLALHVLERVPGLTGAFWSKFPSSLDPRLSSRWISAITFATQLVSLPPPLLIPHHSTSPSIRVDLSTLTPPTLTSLTDTCFPPSLTKSWFSKSLQHDNKLVSFLSSILLIAGLQKSCRILQDVQRVANLLEEDVGGSSVGAGAGAGRWTLLGLRIRDWLRGNVVPDVQIVVSLMSNNSSTSTSIKKNSKEAKDEEDDKKETTMEETRLLRTNVALRLLWLYHRAVPMSISTLKFDFNKLPQNLASSSTTTTTTTLVETEEDESTVDESVEGVRAMSAAYALRLAAVHSDAMSLSKPAEHFKTTLLPLFELDRTSLTQSNRTLLRTNLARLLNTSTLFGNFANREHVQGLVVNVWLKALPDLWSNESSPTSLMVVPNFFQQVVHDTLTMPIKRSTSSSTDHGIPLLSTMLDAFIKRVQTDDNDDDVDELATCVKKVWLGLMGYFGERQVIESCFEVIKTKLGSEKNERVKDVWTFVEQSWRALTEREEMKTRNGLGYVDRFFSVATSWLTVFARDSALHEVPVELVVLRVTDEDLTNSDKLESMVAGMNTDNVAAAVQIFVHRLACGAFSGGDALERAVHLLQLIVGESPSDAVKQMLFGANGLYSLVSTGSAHVRKQIVALLARVLDSDNKSDLVLAEPYCQLVQPLLAVAEPTKSKDKKRKRRRSDVTAGTDEELDWSLPLLSFLPRDSAITLLDRLLDRLGQTEDFDQMTLSNLNEALTRAIKLDDGGRLVQTLWVKHFVTLVKVVLAISDEGRSRLSAGGDLLTRAAQNLMSFSFVGDGDRVLKGTRRRGTEIESAWKAHARDWTDELLKHVATKQGTIGPLVTALVALVYRSAETRSVFVDWIGREENRASSVVLGLRSVLLALTKVGRAHGELHVPVRVVTSLLEASLAQDASMEEAAANTVIEIITTSAKLSAEISSSVKTLLQQRVETLERDEYSAFHLALSTALVRIDDGFKDLAQAFANGCLEGLTRRLAEDPTLSKATLNLVRELARVAETGRIEFKGHLLDTLVTAAIQFKLDVLDIVAMTTRVVRAHSWKDNEITRHVNAVIAKSNFAQPETSSVEATRLQQATIELVLALSKASLRSAASNRVVEKLVPLYGGTLTSLDKQMLDVFRGVELVGGQSVALVLRAWSASRDGVALSDTNGVSCLTGLSPVSLRRSCVAICASSKTPRSTDHDDSTYDPDFLLPFVCSIVMNDELKVHDWVALLESGALSLPVAALASSREASRLVARATLGRAISKLESLQELKERDEMMLVLTQTRMCLYSPVGEPIPAIIALFLSEAMATIGRPSSPRYPLFVRFLLQRPVLDQKDVPMLYQMFYSTSEQPLQDRVWILRMVEMGLCRSQDWKVLRRRQVFELLASLFETAKASHGGFRAKAQNELVRQMVLKVLVRASLIPQAAREMLSRNGILSWIASQTFANANEASLALVVLSNLAASVSDKRAVEVANALETMLLVRRAAHHASATDLARACSTVSKLVDKLLQACAQHSTSSTFQLALDRARDVLSIVSDMEPDDDDLATDQLELIKAFYGAVMLYQFAQSQMAQSTTTSSKDSQLFSKAIEKALAHVSNFASAEAGLDLQLEVIRMTSV
ncbi:hypothetical protein ACM66B_004398 [Microbotryomycetes sp. NB124-2]